MKHRMIRTTMAAAILAASFATTAAAADLCISTDGGWAYIFRKAKKLKPTGAVPLTGIYISGGTAAPVTGSAMANTDGTIRVGIHVSRMAAGSANFDETAVLDATYTGPATYDTNLDTVADGGSNWSAVDCATLAVP